MAIYTDAISRGYQEVIGGDPVKQCVHYPETLRLLGDLRGKDILDVGCGDGTSTRLLVRGGAKAAGYDNSEAQIAVAMHKEEEEPLGISYQLTKEPTDFRSDRVFDAACAVLVLMYAPDKDYLGSFFRSTYEHLRPGGEFVALVANPSFKRLGEILYNRRFLDLGDGRRTVEFFRPGAAGQPVAAGFTSFSLADYEDEAHKAGFSSLRWEPLHVHDHLLEVPPDFWKGFAEDCPYVALVVRT